MANTAPACGACRHCRERGEAGQLHRSRNTRTLILAQKGAAAPFLVRLLRRSALGLHSKLSISRLRLVQLVRILHCHGRRLSTYPLLCWQPSVPTRNQAVAAARSDSHSSWSFRTTL